LSALSPAVIKARTYSELLHFRTASLVHWPRIRTQSACLWKLSGDIACERRRLGDLFLCRAGQCACAGQRAYGIDVEGHQRGTRRLCVDCRNQQRRELYPLRRGRPGRLKADRRPVEPDAFQYSCDIDCRARHDAMFACRIDP
jgi:hypothetical protein